MLRRHLINVMWTRVFCANAFVVCCDFADELDVNAYHLFLKLCP